MTDTGTAALVERLRTIAQTIHASQREHNLHWRAADAIEALQAERDELRAAYLSLVWIMNALRHNADEVDDLKAFIETAVGELPARTKTAAEVLRDAVRCVNGDIPPHDLANTIRAYKEVIDG